jgi:hypothetical protein
MRAGLDGDLCCHSDKTSEQIKGQVAQRAHGILDLRAEGPKEHHIAMIWDQLPCIYMEVSIVSQRWPATISAGMTDQRSMKSGPAINSSKNTKLLMSMMNTVTTGNLDGRLDSS